MKKNLPAFLLVLLSVIIPLSYAFLKSPSPKKLSFSGAYLAIGEFSKQRQFGSSEPFSKLYQNAVQKERLLLKKQVLNDTTWKNLGPDNIAGRMLCLEFNPQNSNTIYSGSASGGLWRSYSGGEGPSAWHRVSLGLPVLSVASIAIHPSDSNIIYIGTGEVYGYGTTEGGEVVRETRGMYGMGLIKSEDGGSTWKTMLSFEKKQLAGIQMIRINPKRPETVWAATTEGLFVSYNSGESWNLNQGIVMNSDLWIQKDDTLKMIAAFGNLGSSGLGIYKSENGGSSWNKINGVFPDFYRGKAVFHAWKQDNNFLMASLGMGYENSDESYLYKSYNFGQTWTQINSDFQYAYYQGWYSHFVGINPADSSDILVGGIDMHRSKDGGKSFSQVSYWTQFDWFPENGGQAGSSEYSHADHHSLTYQPEDAQTIYVTTDGGIFKTQDGGNSWASASGGLVTTQFYAGTSSAKYDSTLILGGLQDNASVIHAGNNRWRMIIGGDGAYTAIHPNIKGLFFASYYYLNVRKTSDYGISFSTVNIPNSDFISAFVAPFRISESSPSVLYAARTVVLKSIDNGNLWNYTNSGRTLSPGNPIHVLEISPLNSDIVFVATSPLTDRMRIFRTVNSGNSWVDVTQDLPNRYAGAMVIHPQNDNIVYLTLSGFGVGHVFKTENAGQTWIDISENLPDLPTQAITIDPEFPNHVYVGNDLGVYQSLQGGGNWEPLFTGLSDAVLVTDLTISKQNRSLRAATYGNGLFERFLPYVFATDSSKNYNAILADFTLEQNYPNPFQFVTTIPVIIEAPTNIKIDLYDINGRFLKTVIQKEETRPGEKKYSFNSANLSSGIYFYRVTVGGKFTKTKKMILIK
jgi:photosystem II stability/assembly factor-like uncharacterized protein